MHMTLEKFKPKICSCCGQTEEYIMTVDLGTVEIVRAIAAAIRRKGENKVYPRKEMEISQEQMKQMGYSRMVKEGYLTSNMVGNLSKARSQGLIARVESGCYCLTSKGANFLKGSSIPKYAVMSKVTGHNIGYWKELEQRVTVRDLIKSGDYWEIDFSIIDRAVVMNVPQTVAFNF